MTLLLQQELLEPTPTRRIIVPADRSAWWGVDPGTQRVSIACVDGEGRRDVRTASFAGLSGGARLAEIFQVTRALAASLVDLWTPPGLVLVEQASGQSENPELVYAVGVIQAAVYEGLCDRIGPVQLETVTSSWWKKRACGRGDIRKTMRVEGRKRPVAVPHESYGVYVWARANGYAGSSWDEADAWGIAEAARRDVALEPR